MLGLLGCNSSMLIYGLPTIIIINNYFPQVLSTMAALVWLWGFEVHVIMIIYTMSLRP